MGRTWHNESSCAPASASSLPTYDWVARLVAWRERCWRTASAYFAMLLLVAEELQKVKQAVMSLSCATLFDPHAYSQPFSWDRSLSIDWGVGICSQKGCPSTTDITTNREEVIAVSQASRSSTSNAPSDSPHAGARWRGQGRRWMGDEAEPSVRGKQLKVLCR